MARPRVAGAAAVGAEGPPSTGGCSKGLPRVALPCGSSDSPRASPSLRAWLDPRRKAVAATASPRPGGTDTGCSNVSDDRTGPNREGSSARLVEWGPNVGDLDRGQSLRVLGSAVDELCWWLPWQRVKLPGPSQACPLRDDRLPSDRNCTPAPSRAVRPGHCRDRVGLRDRSRSRA